MKLFTSKDNSLEKISSEPFRLEKDIQDLVEANTKMLFGLEFVSSEFIVDSFRLDTLCYDEENQSFIIIDYKRTKTSRLSIRATRIYPCY
ncbi:MAG TPA: hypothetical protein DD671_19275 [Balneolaceae bacterium]|nr:hypothetical protein [Balneolaceae bacterium]